MTPTEATDLAVRILQTFHGPSARDWEEELELLEQGRAGTAFARLRREHDQQRLTIARFLEMYRSLNTDDASTRTKCGWCANGWVETQAHEARGRVYSGWAPCTRCADGRANEVSEVWTKSADRQFVSEQDAATFDDGEPVDAAETDSTRPARPAQRTGDQPMSDELTLMDAICAASVCCAPCSGCRDGIMTELGLDPGMTVEWLRYALDLAAEIEWEIDRSGDPFLMGLRARVEAGDGFTQNELVGLPGEPTP